MLVPGGAATAYCSTYANSMMERAQFLPTAAIPNIGAISIDDSSDETG